MRDDAETDRYEAVSRVIDCLEIVQVLKVFDSISVIRHPLSVIRYPSGEAGSKIRTMSMRGFLVRRHSMRMIRDPYGSIASECVQWQVSIRWLMAGRIDAPA